MEAAEESGSATSERDATVVVMNLARLHDLIDDRRANAVQAARQLFAQEQVPATAILSNGTIQVQIPMPDLLAAMDDLQSSPLSEGVSNGGYIDLDPATITPEGMQLLQAAFNSRELRMAEDKAVHLLHICIQLKIEQLFICIDEQPDSYVTDTNFLALTTCLFDHDRCRGRLLQFCLHKLHSLWPKLVTRCPKSLRQLLESCASAPFSDVLVDAFNLAADPEFGGCCNARGGYGMLLHLLRREHTEFQCKNFQSAVTRISSLQHKPLVLLPYLFAKQLFPCGLTCPHCHAHLLYTLMRTKRTPNKVGVIEEIHSSANSCVVIWKVARFRQLNQPTYSFDFRTPQNRVLHLRIDPRGFGRGKDTHLSIFLKESQTLEEDVTFHFVFGVTSSSQDAFVKPMLNCVLSKTRKEYTGRQAFMPLDMIHNGGYIEPDGSLLIMIEIVELSSADKDRRSNKQ